MSRNFRLSTNVHANELERNFDQKTEACLISIGMLAEGFAKQKITREGAIDTGRLRNSITWAIAGKEPNISSYSPDRLPERGEGDEDSVDTLTRPYSGTAPKSFVPAVYVGSNVTYALGIETGKHRKRGAVHFLQDAASNHKDEYRRVVREIFARMDSWLDEGFSVTAPTESSESDGGDVE